jgi:lysozyme
MTITQAQADAVFEADLAPFEAAVNKAVTRPMTQNQFDACVSLAFNIGAAGFATSTVVRKLNAGDTAGAADAFRLWNKAGGQILQGLVNRREAERAQFLAAGAPTIPSPGPVAIPPSKPSLLDRLWSRLTGRKAA